MEQIGVKKCWPDDRRLHERPDFSHKLLWSVYPPNAPSGSQFGFGSIIVRSPISYQITKPICLTRSDRLKDLKGFPMNPTAPIRAESAPSFSRLIWPFAYRARRSPRAIRRSFVLDPLTHYLSTFCTQFMPSRRVLLDRFGQYPGWKQGAGGEIDGRFVLPILAWKTI